MIAFKTLFLAAGVYGSVCAAAGHRGSQGGEDRGGLPEPHKICKMFPTILSRVSGHRQATLKSARACTAVRNGRWLTASENTHPRGKPQRRTFLHLRSQTSSEHDTEQSNFCTCEKEQTPASQGASFFPQLCHLQKFIFPYNSIFRRILTSLESKPVEAFL